MVCGRTSQLAGGDLLADRSLLADEATERLRGAQALPSHTTLWRFCAGADVGRGGDRGGGQPVHAAASVGHRGAAGARPAIDPVATRVPVYGDNKEGSTSSYGHEVSLSPIVGVCGDTGDVLAFPEGALNPDRGVALL